MWGKKDGEGGLSNASLFLGCKSAKGLGPFYLKRGALSHNLLLLIPEPLFLLWFHSIVY